MSRKWERSVERNRRQVNAQRAKWSKYDKKKKRSEIKQKEEGLFQGRNVFISILCVSVSGMFLLFFGQTGESETLFWLTVICYSLLAVYFFFVRRPYIKVGKAEIVIKRLGREKVTPANDIEKVTVQEGYVIISIKGKRTQLVFSRFFNRYDIHGLAQRLKDFSQKHSIQYEIIK